MSIPKKEKKKKKFIQACVVLGRLVPELGGLGYFKKKTGFHFVNPKKEKKIKIKKFIQACVFFTQIGTRAWWARVLHKVPSHQVWYGTWWA